MRADPIADAVQAFRGIDAHYARLLGAIADADPEGGVPAERLIGLAANVTGWDVAFLTSCVEVLRAMPRLRTAFADGRISWSQLRPIISRARRLSVEGRRRLDELLAGPIAANATSEPEALVDHAQAITTRLEDLAAAERELDVERRSFIRFQPDLFGGADLWGHLDDVAAATLVSAIDAAADAPVADDPVLDDDGNPVPRSWQAPTARSEQRAEGLHRLASAYLSGSRTGTAKPTVQVIVDIRTLTGTTRPAHPSTEIAATTGALTDTSPGRAIDCHSEATVPLASSRIIWNLAGGRRPTSTARVLQLSCDATWVPLLTDGTAVLATGDAHDPISTALRRAVLTRDQGCRFPGCRAPAAHCDLHHLTRRVDGGPTTAENLVALCRHHHSLIERHTWHLTLHPDATLTVRRGRHRLISRPRLRPPTVSAAASTTIGSWLAGDRTATGRSHRGDHARGDDASRFGSRGAALVGATPQHGSDPPPA